MKLYLVVRDDLAPGQQAVQAAHALREFGALYPSEDQIWYRASNTLALLVVPNEECLKRLLGEIQEYGHPVAPFREPDLEQSLTAIAVGPSGKRHCRGLPLALKLP